MLIGVADQVNLESGDALAVFGLPSNPGARWNRPHRPASCP